MNASGEPISDKIKLLIVEDHPIVREGLRAILATKPNIEICGEASDSKDVDGMVSALAPNLILLDLVIGETDGLELIKSLRNRHTEIKILVLSMHEENIYAERVLKAGASGYIMKQEAAEKILEGIQCVLRGEIYVSNEVAGNFMKRTLRSPGREGKSGLESLSDRELHIFQLIGKGNTTRAIAESLNISIKTVESHRENIKNKLSLENATSLVRQATLWVEEQHR